MRRSSILSSIKRMGKQIFTSHEMSSISGKSISATTQSLNNLVKEGVVIKIYRGIWAQTGDSMVSPYAVIPYLFPGHRAYVSFISALHLHGIIEQIPQVTTVASTAHARIIKTAIGTYHVHRLMPSFFTGFEWYKQGGNFLIAQPEKALIDSLYLSAHKGKRFGYFPELNFSKSFSFKKARSWADSIPNRTTRTYVNKKLKEIF